MEVTVIEPETPEKIAEPFDVPELTPEEIFRRAAERIEKYGWVPMALFASKERSCFVGAIWKAANPGVEQPPLSESVYEEVTILLGGLPAGIAAAWNDSLPDLTEDDRRRSGQHVASVLRLMAWGMPAKQAMGAPFIATYVR